MLRSFRPRPHPRTTLFPYTTLFRSNRTVENAIIGDPGAGAASRSCYSGRSQAKPESTCATGKFLRPDRKSTRLNSSHTVISYAVFCLKKKKGRLLECRLVQARSPRT